MPIPTRRLALVVALASIAMVIVGSVAGFWLVNLAAGATGMPLRSYIVGTFVGVIPATFVFASLGSGVSDVLAQGRRPDLGVIFQPGVLLPIVGLAALALLPTLYRRWRTDRVAS